VESPNQSNNRSVLKRFTPVLAFAAICWGLLIVNNVFLGGQLNQHGIIPRQVASLPAILWSPFLHTSISHLTANTLPLLVLGLLICARGNGEFVLVAIGGTVLGGLLTWLFARTGSHVGASGLIFYFFGYLTALAWFKKSFGTLVLAIVCLVAYGGILTGILPRSATVSWEGHAAGLISGIALARITSKLTSNASPVPTTAIPPVSTGSADK